MRGNDDACGRFRDKPIIDYFVKVIEPDKPIAKVVKISDTLLRYKKGLRTILGLGWAPPINTNNTNANLTWSSIPPDANNNNSTLATTGVTITGIINNFIPKLMDAVSNNKGRSYSQRQ